VKFFNLDLHISVISDIKRIFADLGHQVDDWTLSGHSWAIGRTRDSVDIINHENWHDLNKEMCDDFYERYKDELSKYDGFICTYAPSFCLLFEKFNKPIITVAPIRYEAPFWDDRERWEWYNNYLREGIDSGLIVPVANNKVDKKYCETYTEREWAHIPSLCEYTESFYSPKHSSFLYSSLFPMETMHYDAAIRNKQEALKPGYKWPELTEYKGIVHIPYTCSTMSIFENYTSCMPMFFPSIDFMTQLRKTFGSLGVLNQLSWREVRQLKPGSEIVLPPGAPDLNDYGNTAAERPWIELSDFYDKEWMPHLKYFDSFPHLSEMIRTTDLNQTSQDMENFNKIRKQKIYKLWEDVLKNVV